MGFVSFHLVALTYLRRAVRVWVGAHPMGTDVAVFSAKSSVPTGLVERGSAEAAVGQLTGEQVAAWLVSHAGSAAV